MDEEWVWGTKDNRQGMGKLWMRQGMDEKRGRNKEDKKRREFKVKTVKDGEVKVKQGDE